MMKFSSVDRRLFFGGLSCVSALAFIWLYPFLLLSIVLLALAAYFAYKHKLKLYPSSTVLTLNHTQSKARFRRRNYSQATNFSSDTFKQTPDLISTAASFGVLWNQNLQSELKARRLVRSLPGSQYSPDFKQNDINNKQKDGSWNLGKSKYSPSRGSPSCGFASQVVSSAFHQNYPVHQPPYGTLGLFPAINLQKVPLPLLSEKNSSMVTSPVTIKIAPPDAVKTPKSRIDFLFNNTVKKSPQTDSVVTALQSCRKRAFKTINEEEEGNVFKRQRRDSCSSSNGSAFMTPPSNGIYNGMIRSSNTLSPQPGKLSHHSLPPLKTSNGNNASTRKFKNNEIYSSYSSSKAFWKHQAKKTQSHKRKIARCSSPAVKVSKLHSSENPGELSGRLSSTKSDESMSSDHLADSSDGDLTVEAFEDNISTKSPLNATGLPWKKGYSLKHQLPLYSSLAVTPKFPLSHITHSNATLEDDDKDKQANEARLQKLLAGVNKAFQSKEEFRKQNVEECLKVELLASQSKNSKLSPALSIGASNISSSVGTTSAETPSSATSTSTSNLLVSSQPLFPFINAKISSVESKIPMSTSSSATVLNSSSNKESTDNSFQSIHGNSTQNATVATSLQSELTKTPIISLSSDSVHENNSVNATTSSTQPSLNFTTANTVPASFLFGVTSASKPSTPFFPTFSTSLSAAVTSVTASSSAVTSVSTATTTTSQLFSPFSSPNVSSFDNNSCSFVVKDVLKKDATPFNSASVNLTTNAFSGKLEQSLPTTSVAMLGKNTTQSNIASVSEAVQSKPIINSTTVTTPFSFGASSNSFNFGSSSAIPNFSFGSQSSTKFNEQKQPVSETIPQFNFVSSNLSGNQSNIFKNVNNESNPLKFPANGPLNSSIATSSSKSQPVSSAPVFVFGQTNNMAFSSPFTFSAAAGGSSQPQVGMFPSAGDSSSQNTSSGNPFVVTSPASAGFNFNAPAINFSAGTGRKQVQNRRRSNRS